MMHRSKLGLVALLAAAFLGLPPNRAGATFQIFAQEAGVNGGAITSIGSAADFTSVSFTGTYGDFALTIFGAKSDNGAALSDLLKGTVKIENTADTTKTITLYASQTNYTLPLGATLKVESGVSGTVNSGTLTGTGVFQAYADKNNNLLGTGDFTNGPQSVVFNGSTFDSGSANGVFTRDATPYSVTSVTTAQISAHGSGNFSSHINLIATPEPGTLTLFAGLFFGLGGSALYRSRKVRQAGAC